MASPQAVIDALRAAGCVFAEDEAELLLESGASEPDLTELVRRRVAGEPLEYLLGWAEFAGLRIAVEPGVFVPRRRTELMVSVAVRRLAGRVPAVLLDLCCGSGAVACAVSAAVPDARVFATDCDPVAVRCARRNLPTDAVFHGDLYQPVPSRLRGQVDVLVANAPYVPTDSIALMPPEARLYEAPVALNGGSDGLDVLRRVIAGAGPWLVPDGSLLVEAAESQLAALMEFSRSCSLQATVHTDDEVGAIVVELQA